MALSADVGDSWGKILLKVIGVGGDGGAEGTTTLASAPERRGPVGCRASPHAPWRPAAASFVRREIASRYC